MDLMRSEEMQLLQVIIPTESAHLAVSNLGDLGLIQFKDVSPPHPARSRPQFDFTRLAATGGGGSGHRPPRCADLSSWLVDIVACSRFSRNQPRFADDIANFGNA
jgi:hypothetical protein